MSDALRVGLLGCGVVGSQVVRLLDEQADELAARIGRPIELVAVAVRRPNKHPDVPAELLTTDASSMVERDDIDLIVEVVGGIEPVRTLLLQALRSGKSVVSFVVSAAECFFIDSEHKMNLAKLMAGSVS